MYDRVDEWVMSALNEFEGTVMLVSHDRALLREVCDEFWLVAAGGVRPFDGDLDDYATWVIERRRVQTRPDGGGAEPRRRGDQRRQAAGERERLAKARRPLRSRLDDVEQRLQAAGQEVKELDTQLASEAFYSGDPEAVAQALCMKTEDFARAYHAFADKRKPVFEGN